MPYITPAGLIARYGERELIQLTDRDNSGAIVAAVLELAITDACAEIDSYLAQRMALPLAPEPAAVLERHAAILTRAALTIDAAADHPALVARAATLAWLRDVARGVASLGPAPDAPAAPAGRGGVRAPAKSYDWSKVP